MPLKFQFVLSRYLDRSPRYKRSNTFHILNALRKLREWARDPVTHIVS